jgi:hypothetical protein
MYLSHFQDVIRIGCSCIITPYTVGMYIDNPHAIIIAEKIDRAKERFPLKRKDRYTKFDS